LGKRNVETGEEREAGKKFQKAKANVPKHAAAMVSDPGIGGNYRVGKSIGE